MNKWIVSIVIVLCLQVLFALLVFYHSGWWLLPQYLLIPVFPYVTVRATMEYMRVTKERKED